MAVAFPPYSSVTTGVNPGEWRLTVRGHEREDARYLRDWDCTTDVRAETQVQVEHQSVLSQTHLTDDDTIALVIVAQSTTVPHVQVSDPTVITGSGTFTVSLDLVPHETGGTVSLERQLLLQGRRSDDPTSASEPGSILWADSENFVVELEGEHSRFPSEQVDFSKAGLPSRAMWSLHIEDADLNRNVLSTVRLHLNSTHHVVRAVLSADNEPLADVVGDMINLDVARRLITRALANSEFDPEKEDYEEGSLGATYTQLLRRAFDSQNVYQVRQLRNNDETRFEAELQDRFGPTDGGAT